VKHLNLTLAVGVPVLHFAERAVPKPPFTHTPAAPFFTVMTCDDHEKKLLAMQAGRARLFMETMCNIDKSQCWQEQFDSLSDCAEDFLLRAYKMDTEETDPDILYARKMSWQSQEFIIRTCLQHCLRFSEFGHSSFSDAAQKYIAKLKEMEVNP